MTHHAMIDLETLGLGVRAPLFEIGVTIFNIETCTVVGSMQIDVDLLDVVMSTGFVPQQDTVDWWRKNTYDPRRLPRVSLSAALEMLSDRLTTENVSHIWANSPSFDCVILEEHYKAIGLKPVWEFRQEVDFRTMKWLHRDYLGQEMPPVADEVVSHNAERDSQQQTEILLHILRTQLLRQVK